MQRAPDASLSPADPEVRSGKGPKRLQRLALRSLDAAIPEPLHRGDPEDLRRARIILSCTLVMIGLGIETIVFFLWALPPQLVLPIGLSLLAGLLIVLPIPATLRRGLPLAVPANLLVFACYLVIATSLTVAGGLQAPLLHWFALLPMLALLMGGRRSAWAWICIALATVLGFGVADSAGVRYPALVTLSQLSGPTLWAQRLVDLGSWIGILFTVSLLYEAHKAQQTHQLAAQNARLETEIEQRRTAEERNQYLAYYDELTTLPNRRLFQEHLQAAIAEAPRIGRQVAVLFLDLDGFKEVNDSLGHEVGDRLLQQVATRLQRCIRLSDLAARASEDPRVVSRLGGDEFTILLTCIRDHWEVATVCKRILRSLESPFLLGDHEAFITASIGIAMHPNVARDLDDLLRKADLAMYHAKQRGKNTFEFFEESMNRDVLTHASIARGLRHALERGEFELHFQPIVAARGHGVLALEALARWRHPERGLVRAREFIEVAEQSGLIVPLGDWVFREAFRHLARWTADGIAPPRIAVNVSGPQLRRGMLLESLRDALRAFDVDARRLELEVTEGAMLVDEDEASRCLGQLKALGIRVALDDFGTGYSSLSYVRRFPVDSLKIDHSFVRDVVSDPEARAIAGAIIAMAHELRLEVVGEGVETAEQERFLREQGCDGLQGSRLGPPLPPAEMARWLAARNGRSGPAPRG